MSYRNSFEDDCDVRITKKNVISHNLYLNNKPLSAR